MQALIVVVPPIPTQLLTELSDGVKRPTVNHVGLERMEEGLHVRVLVGRPAARHALLDARGEQPVAKRRPQKLAAPIAVKDEPRARTAPAERRVDRGPREPCVTGDGEPPGQHAPGVLIQHHREIPPATGDGELREIPDPNLIPPRGLRPSHAIRMLAEPPMGSRLPAIDARHTRAHPALTHQAFHASMTEPKPTHGQRPMDPRAAVGAPALLEDRTHLFEDTPVLPLAGTHRPLAPRVVPGPRDPK